LIAIKLVKNSLFTNFLSTER